MPFSTISHWSAGTPSSSHATRESEPACVRSAWTFMIGGPYLSWPIIFSGGATKLVPA